MEPSAGRDLQLRRLLDAAEDASPVSAVEAVSRELGGSLGATSVSFLIADLSGRALVRLAQVSPGSEPVDGVRYDERESAEILPFNGGPAEQALRTQEVHVLPPDNGPSWTVLAPITERGDVLGLLELDLLTEPSPETVSEIRRTAHVLGYVIIASRRHTDLYEWGQRSTPYSLSAENPTATAATRVHVRSGVVHPLVLARARRRRRRRHTRLQPGSRRTAPVSH